MRLVENTDALAYLHGLCALRPRVSTLRLRALLDAAGSPASAWNADGPLLKRAGWTEEAVTTLTEHRRRWDLASEYARLGALGIRLVPLEVPEVPPLLPHIYDPPLALYVRGKLPGDALAIAVVGSRTATPYGRAATQALVRPLSARGLVIVSGLAFGIDAEAHRAALETHGTTVAVLGTGVDEASVYPRSHRQLAKDIVAASGAVASEFPPGTTARPEHFPQRNRIIAGLARATVVVEATTQSGALITARLALAENREVLAVPGPITAPTSEGTNRLLREGAAPALSADDILDALSLRDTLAPPLLRAPGADRPESGKHARPRVPRNVLRAAVATPSGQGLPAAGGEERGARRSEESRWDSGATASEDARGRPRGEETTFTPHADHAARVLSFLSADPQTIDELLAVCTLPPHEVAATLTVLELEGRVRDVGGKHYVRV